MKSKKGNQIKKQIARIKLYLSESNSLFYACKRKLLPTKFPRLLVNRINPKFFNHTARRINRIMQDKDYDYLEIGVADGTTLQSVSSKRKHGVDPFPLFNLKRLPEGITFDLATSNDYFNELHNDKKFNFIFLDGLHESSQLMLDLLNALKHISIPGWILIDDIVPSDSISAISSMEKSYQIRGVSQNEGYPWHGDCYKILPFIQERFPEIELFLIIYPDNPQLLLRIDQPLILERIQNIPQKLNFDYFEVFSLKKLQSYPIFIEEVLIKELTRRGWIANSD